MIINSRLAFFRNLRATYVIYFGIVLVLKEIGLYTFIPNLLNSLLVIPAGLIGVLFIVNDTFLMVKKRKFEFNIFLVTFLVIMSISTFLNYQYGFNSNIKLIINEAIFLLVIYNFSRLEIESSKYIDIFCKLLIGIWTFLVGLSFIMFILKMSYSIKIENRFHPLRMGLVENRLFGIFSDPNFASTICLVVIILLIMRLILSESRKLAKVFFISSITLNLFFILLSGSRTGMVELLSVSLVGIFIFLYHKSLSHGKSFVNSFLVSLVISGVSTVFLYLILELIKKGLVLLPEFIDHFSVRKREGSNQLGDSTTNLTRKDIVENSDYSNGRFTIWKNGIELFKSRKFFGVGPSREGIVTFSKVNLENSYVGNSGLSLHSFIIQTLAGTGIFGFVSFFTFFVQKTFMGVSLLFRDSNIIQSRSFYYLLSIFAISINAVFSSEIILVNKIGAFIFWLFLGYVANQSSIKN